MREEKRGQTRQEGTTAGVAYKTLAGGTYIQTGEVILESALWYSATLGSLLIGSIRRMVAAGGTMLVHPICTARGVSYVTNIISKP